MDNEYTHSEHGQGHGEGEPAPAPVEAAAPLDAATVIEQVRELLFGDHRRTTEGSLKGIEDRLAALTATIEARFADIERRLNDSRTETDHARESHVEAIGAALSDLGEKIKGLVGKPPA